MIYSQIKKGRFFLIKTKLNMEQMETEV